MDLGSEADHATEEVLVEVVPEWAPLAAEVKYVHDRSLAGGRGHKLRLTHTFEIKRNRNDV